MKKNNLHDRFDATETYCCWQESSDNKDIPKLKKSLMPWMRQVVPVKYRSMVKWIVKRIPKSNVDPYYRCSVAWKIGPVKSSS